MLSPSSTVFTSKVEIEMVSVLGFGNASFWSPFSSLIPILRSFGTDPGSLFVVMGAGCGAGGGAGTETQKLKGAVEAVEKLSTLNGVRTGGGTGVPNGNLALALPVLLLAVLLLVLLATAVAVLVLVLVLRFCTSQIK
jgi:hypothetical protein